MKKKLNITIWKNLKIINFTIWKIHIFQFEKLLKFATERAIRKAVRTMDTDMLHIALKMPWFMNKTMYQMFHILLYYSSYSHLQIDILLVILYIIIINFAEDVGQFYVVDTPSHSHTWNFAHLASSRPSSGTDVFQKLTRLKANFRRKSKHSRVSNFLASLWKHESGRKLLIADSFCTTSTASWD